MYTLYHPLNCNTPGDPLSVPTRTDYVNLLKQGFFIADKPSAAEIQDAIVQRLEDEQRRMDEHYDAIMKEAEEQIEFITKPIQKRDKK